MKGENFFFCYKCRDVASAGTVRFDKMNQIEKLNSLLAFLKIKDLVQNKDYKVHNLEKTSARYGEAILAY